MTNEQLQYLKRMLKKRSEKPSGDEPEAKHNSTEEKAEQGFNPLYARMKPATPQKQYLVEDSGDQTEKLYTQWKKTGKLPGNRGIEAKNNGLLETFRRRLKRENG